uniref:VQ domain-containing protein n=1 Tax=Chenopodium quinoa TaxID=63459 RepID=A0A803ND70_CHEQI
MSQLFNMNYRTYEDLTLEFLSSFDIEKGRNGLVKHVVYRLLNRSHRMSLEGFARKFGLPCTGLTVQPSSFNSGELWFAMTGENIESFQHAPSHKIHQPVLRLWTRFTGWTIFGRIEPNNVRSDEISILGSYLRRGDEDGDFTMNIAHLFALHLKKQGTTYTTIKSNGERSNIPIVLGGLVTHLALREGFDEASRCPVPGPITLDQHYLTTAGWLSIDFNRFSWIIGRTNRFSVPLPSPALTKIMPHQPSYLLQFPSDSSTPAIMAGIRELRVGQLDLSTRVQTIETSLRELNAGQQDFRLAMYPVYDYFCRQGNIPRDGPHPSCLPHHHQQQRQQEVKGKRSKKPSGMGKKSFKKVEAMKVVYISTPMKVTTSASKFRAIVQELTGRESDVVNIMETSGGNDTWIINEDHIVSGCNTPEVTKNYANTNQRSLLDNTNQRSLVDNTNERSLVDNTNGSSPSVSSSEEFVEQFDGVFVKGQDSNFGVIDHSSFLYDQFFHQLDVLGYY